MANRNRTQNANFATLYGYGLEAKRHTFDRRMDSSLRDMRAGRRNDAAQCLQCSKFVTPAQLNGPCVPSVEVNRV